MCLPFSNKMMQNSVKQFVFTKILLVKLALIYRADRIIMHQGKSLLFLIVLMHSE